MPSTRSVLLAGDSPDTRNTFARALAGDSWTVECAANVAAVETRMDGGEVNVLVTDLGVSPADDVRTLRRIRRRHPKARVIVLAEAHAHTPSWRRSRSTHSATSPSRSRM